MDPNKPLFQIAQPQPVQIQQSQPLPTPQLQQTPTAGQSAQPAQPPQNPLSQAANAFGNAVKSLMGNAGQEFQQDAANANRNIVVPVKQGVSDYMKGNAQLNPFKTLQPDQNDSAPVAIGKSLINMMPQMGNLIANFGIGTTVDVGRNLENTLQGKPLTSYNDLKSPASKLGYNIGSAINPQAGKQYSINDQANEVLGNIGGTLLPIIAAYGIGGTAKAIDEAATPVTQTLKQVILHSAAKMGISGAAYGFTSGLDQYRNDTVTNQIKNAGVQGVAGGTIGAILGVITPLATVGVLKLAGKMTNNPTMQAAMQQATSNPEAGNIQISPENNAPASPEDFVARKFAQVGWKGLEPEEQQVMIHQPLTQLDYEQSNQAYKDAFLNGGKSKADLQNLQEIEQSAGERVHGHADMGNYEDAYHAGDFNLAKQIAQESDNPTLKNMGANLPENNPVSISTGEQTTPSADLKNDYLKSPLPEDLSQKSDIVQSGVNAENPAGLPNNNEVTPGQGTPESNTPNAQLLQIADNIKNNGWSREEFLNQINPKMGSVSPDIAASNQGTIDLLNSQNLTPGHFYDTYVTGPKTAPAAAVMDAMNPEISGKGALTQRFSAITQINESAKVLGHEMQSVLGKDPDATELFRQAVEHPEQLDQFAQNFADKVGGEAQDFKDLVGQFQNHTDLVYGLAKDAKMPLGYLINYYSHLVDLDTPEKQDIFNNLMKTLNDQGYFSKERIYPDINALRAAGLDLKNPTAIQDLQDYTNSATRAIGGQTLFKALQEQYPRDIVEISQAGGVPRDINGRPFVPLQIPGLQGTAVSQELYGQIKQLEPADLPGWAKMVQTVNRADKELRLGGGAFHALNTAPSFIGAKIMEGSFPNPLQMAAISVDGDSFNGYLQNMQEKGVVKIAADMGVTLGGNLDVGSSDSIIPQGVNKIPVIAQLHDAIFDRMIPYFKLNLVDTLVNQGKIDTATPEGLQAAQQIGAQLNNLFGGQNTDLGQSIFGTGVNRFLANLAILAPDYQEGQIKNLTSAASAIFNPNAGNTFAARALIGRLGVIASVSALAAAVTGQMPKNPVDAVNKFVLNPQIPFPWNNPKGESQVGKLPSSALTTVFRLVTDPDHTFQSHMGAIVSDAIKYFSNQDYYGNPLSENNSPLEKLASLATSDLPIPAVQAGKLVQGKVNIPTALSNEIGIRVVANPDDPKVKATADYFNGIKIGQQGLNKNEINTWNGVLTPTKTDANGKIIKNYNNEVKPEFYTALLSDPTLLDHYQKFEQGQTNHDPMWDLNPNQLHAAMLYYQLKYANPTGGFSGADPTVKALAASLPTGFFQSRQDYFSNLIKQGVMTPSASSTGFQMSPEVQKFWSSYSSLPYGTGARKSALATTLGQQALAELQQEQTATNQTRADMGLPLLSSTSSTGSTGSSYKSRSGLSRMMNAYKIRASDAKIRNHVAPLHFSPGQIKPIGPASPKIAIAPKQKKLNSRVNIKAVGKSNPNFVKMAGIGKMNSIKKPSLYKIQSHSPHFTIA